MEGTRRSPGPENTRNVGTRSGGLGDDAARPISGVGITSVGRWKCGDPIVMAIATFSETALSAASTRSTTSPPTL
jgi:hypothetical protein